MARLESQSKLLYYPTPNAIAETIATWFSTPWQTRIADPCCGTGEALALFSKDFKAERIGIELSYSRAQAAEKVLDKVLPTSFYTATWSTNSVGLMFNNPPYDYSQYSEVVNGQSRSIRHEVLFVERARDKIVVGGHHVIIIPRYILGDPHYLGNGQQDRVARHLLGWYEDVLIYRFPDGEYEAFKQVVVLACKRRGKYQPPTKDAINVIVAMANESTDIPVLPEGQGQYEIPAVSGQYVFKYTPREPGDVVRAIRRANPLKSAEWTRATYVQPIGESFNPVETIKVGHITLLVSSGNVGAVSIPDEGLLIKGTSRKSLLRSVTTEIDEDGDQFDKVTTAEKFEPIWTIADKNGQIKVVSEIEEIAKLATQYARQLADAVQVKNAPLYANNPTAQEWARTARIGVGMPSLPGRSEKGLFERQRHWSIALSRTMKKNRHAIANLGMGTGKTLISVATLNTLDEFPAIVTCPAHMPAEWIKTLTKGSDPDAPIRAMHITRPVSDIAPVQPPAQIEVNGEIIDFSKLASPIFHPRYQPGWITEWNANTGSKWVSFCKTVENAGGTVTSDIRWHDEESDVVRRWRKVAVACDLTQANQLAALFSRTLVVRQDGITYKPEFKFRPDGFDITYFDSDEYTLFDFEQDYRAGKLGRKAVAVVSLESAKYDAGDEPGIRVFKNHSVEADEETGELYRVERNICPVCNQAVRPGLRKCENRIEKQKLAAPITDESGKVISYHLEVLPDEKSLPVCGAPLFQFSRFRRIGAARLTQKKLRGFFQVYVADELHKAKALDTDAGVADQRLIAGTRYSLGLTGTLFGGNASSIFPILYRRVPEVRARFAFHDHTRWVDSYGLWEKKWNERNASITGVGATTGIKRWGYRSRELPGVSPAVIRYLLPLAVFGQVQDLDYELPPFSDEVEIIPMSSEMAEQYAVNQIILSKAMEILKNDRDPGGLSVWFNFCRFRANSMFRPEVVAYAGGSGFLFNLPAISGWLPKEKRLAEIVAQNARNGRKTLIFAEQSGGRDIRHRMKKAAEELAGRPLRIEILSASDMAPAKRMAWIKANAPSMDALIVNPKLVETGLTLTMFSDIVFYELTPSLYVLWQSMRRVWRLGQNRNVTTKFLAYGETVEADILQRMGRKMKYASMLYGDSAASVLESDDENGSIQEEIIRAALAGSLEDERRSIGKVEKIFSTGNEKTVAVSTEVTGSIVAATPALPTTMVEWAALKGAPVAMRRKKAAPAAGQMSLF